MKLPFDIRSKLPFDIRSPVETDIQKIVARIQSLRLRPDWMYIDETGFPHQFVDDRRNYLFDYYFNPDHIMFIGQYIYKRCLYRMRCTVTSQLSMHHALKTAMLLGCRPNLVLSSENEVWKYYSDMSISKQQLNDYEVMQISPQETASIILSQQAMPIDPHLVTNLDGYEFTTNDGMSL